MTSLQQRYRAHRTARGENRTATVTGNVPVRGSTGDAAITGACSRRSAADSLILSPMFRICAYLKVAPQGHLFFLFCVAALASCDKRPQGEALARTHCASCHRFPEPQLLDKKTWKTGIFPEMSLRMGRNLTQLPGTDARELHEILQAIPPEPLVSDEEWEAISAYYQSHAPDSLNAVPEDNKLPLQQFSPATVTLPISGNSLLTMVRTHPENEKIYVATRQRKLFTFSRSFAPLDSVVLDGPASDIAFTNEGTLVLSMGIMDPNDQSAGSVMKLLDEDNAPTLVIDSLKRPVDLARADLNQDGREDLLVSAFGNFTGGLLAYEKTDSGYQRHIVHPFPGNRKAIVRDFNGDGLPDILALISQGNEHIALFTNRGKFRFSYQVVLRFPPVYGSSYIELEDFNDDGMPDILYTNGDNADYSAVLKPYHGVRIFLNDGRNHFSERWFYPMYGASMAHASDYDGDGDIDIAAIAFFPDFARHPAHGFLYFENKNGNFEPSYTPLARKGRWISMESSDIDGDGDEDLLLASLTFPTSVPEALFQNWGRDKVSLLVLRNNRF